MAQFVWLAAFIVFVVVESVTVQLVSIWFGCGALVSFILSFFVTDVFIQALVFVAVSAVCFLLTRPLAKKIHSRTIVHTNADNVVGMEGTALSDIRPLDGMETGRVILNSQDWAAVCAGGQFIPKGSIVRVCSISGVKLMVERI